MITGRRLCAAICWLVLCAGRAQAQADVVVVTRGAEDAEVRRQLATLLDRAVGERPEPSPRAASAILQDPATSWPEAYVVVIDRTGDSVHVLRPRDRTMVSRVLAPEVIAESAYAVALATAELLEWLGATPPTREPERLATSAPQPTENRVRAPRVPTDQGTRPTALSWAAGADLELSSNPGHDVSLIRPSVSAELQLGRSAWPAWLAFGLRASAPASFEPRLGPSVVANGVREVEYSSTDLALHAAIGTGNGPAALAAGLVSGVSLIDVEARARQGEVAGSHDELRGWVGLGLWLRYPIAWGLGLSLGAEAHWLANRARYRVMDEPVLEEGPVQLQTRVGLLWESAFSR